MRFIWCGYFTYKSLFFITHESWVDILSAMDHRDKGSTSIGASWFFLAIFRSCPKILSGMGFNGVSKCQRWNLNLFKHQDCAKCTSYVLYCWFNYKIFPKLRRKLTISNGKHDLIRQRTRNYFTDSSLILQTVKIIDLLKKKLLFWNWGGIIISFTNESLIKVSTKG